MEPEGALRLGQGMVPTRDFWSPDWGSTELLLPRRESRRLGAASRFGELFGVGMGVAAVRMMTGGGRLPRPSRCPLGVTAREYIFISGGRRGRSLFQGSQEEESPCPGLAHGESPLGQVSTGSTPSILVSVVPTHTCGPEVSEFIEILVQVGGCLIFVCVRSVGVTLHPQSRRHM